MSGGHFDPVQAKPHQFEVIHLKRRDLIKKLEAAGYRLARDDGDHTVYRKPGSPNISVPRHRELNELTAKAILRAAGLK